MNNRIIIAIVVAAAVAAGVVYFSINRGAIVAPGRVVANSETAAALVAAGRPVKCTIAPTAENNNMSGTFYVVNKKVRGDYSVKTGVNPMSGHMIVDGATTYSWIDGQPMGFKMMGNVKAAGGANAGLLPVSEGQPFDQSKLANYKCEGWSGDDSFFAVPGNVKFTEPGSAGLVPPTPPVRGSAGAGAGVNGSAGDGAIAPVGKATQCATCDSMPAAYQAQCKAALGCK
jgi:hypothetical protein